MGFVALRLDYISCVLTILSTVLVGKRLWEGWALAGVNSVIICVIGLKTAQWGFIPANLFCIILYLVNLHAWRKRKRLSEQHRGCLSSAHRGTPL